MPRAGARILCCARLARPSWPRHKIQALRYLVSERYPSDRKGCTQEGTERGATRSALSPCFAKVTPDAAARARILYQQPTSPRPDLPPCRKGKANKSLGVVLVVLARELPWCLRLAAGLDAGDDANVASQPDVSFVTRSSSMLPPSSQSASSRRSSSTSTSSLSPAATMPPTSQRFVHQSTKPTHNVKLVLHWRCRDLERQEVVEPLPMPSETSKHVQISRLPPKGNAEHRREMHALD